MTIESFEHALLLSNVTDAPSLFATFSEALSFGEHFGKNWDALGDSMVEAASKLDRSSTLVVLIEGGLEEDEIEELYDVVEQCNQTVKEHLFELVVIHQPARQS